MGGIDLATLLAEIHGIGPRFVARLSGLKIKTVGDLLRHLPSRYEDFSQIYRIAELEPGQVATIQGTIESIDTRRSWRRGMMITEATIADETGTIRAVWFNQPYLKNLLRPGRLANFSGKVTVSDDELSLSHPTHELLSSHDVQETRHTGRLVPIYPETRGLTSKGIRFLVQPLLKATAFPPEWIPEEVLAARHFPPLQEAFRAVHFPRQIEDAERARERFAFEELFLLQLAHLEAKLAAARDKAPAIPADLDEVRRMIAALPFSLTISQKKSLWEILQDLARPHPMHRLLQGDVGSGKTVVAALAAVVASAAGYQTAFMAPTEVLAAQHYATMKKLFTAISPTHQPAIGLLTSAQAKLFYENDVEADVSKKECAKKIMSGEIAITIGTHALLQKTVQFKNLAFVIVDEQHRFGVRQRAQLAARTTTETIIESPSKSASSPRKSVSVPHLLSMSATPIPRTLTLALFGDLDISAITELPPGRTAITTKVVAPADRPKAYTFIRKEVKKGRQAFVICPRIQAQTEAERTQTNADAVQYQSAYRQRMSLVLTEVKAVKEEYEKLSKTIFPDLRVGMLHGQMPAKAKKRKEDFTPKTQAKEEVMRAFHEKKIDVLVSTSVVEVGVDIPNATVMMIEGADRFGLAQLYQFRGRVGRGAHQSYCFLFTDATSKTTFARLHAVRDAKNGFELAEIDLKLRGPGEFLGEKQTGLPDIAMQGLTDPLLMKSSRDAAVAILEKDPALRHHAPLAAKLAEFKKRIHPE